MKLAQRTSVVLILLLLAGCSAGRPNTKSGRDEADVPLAKRTTLGLYIAAADAYEMWRADPDRVFLLDVRTPGEYVFVGHAKAAHNVPLEFLQNRWDAEASGPVMEANPYFVAEVGQRFTPTDVLLVISRDGTRGAKAVNALAAAGFANAYNVVDGFEGDEVTDPQSAHRGKRVKNGWTNAGAPWTYDLDPDLMYLPDDAQ